MGNLIHRGKGSWTHVENTVFFDRELSAKAKGIYCQIRSLETNPSWTFTVAGFTALMRDGPAAVTAGLKELENAGYVIRARKRSERGRFLKAEDAIWITLDDPTQHEAVVAELKADGFAIQSEFTRTRRAEQPELPFDDSSPVTTRTRKSTSGESTSGKSSTINHLDHQPLTRTTTNPSLADGSSADAQKGSEGGKGKGAYVQGEFPEAFQELCEKSIKPITSLAFKRDCLGAWEKRVSQGYSPEAILDAYARYAESYFVRNGTDTTCAKNLARWLEGPGGLADYADEPASPGLRTADGEPLPIEQLAQASPEFAVIWRKVETRRSVLRSYEPDLDSEAFAAVLEADEHYVRFRSAAQEAYENYLSACEMFGAMRSPERR